MKRVINGFQMNYEDVGRGPALLLIHGFPLDHTLWTHQVDAFRDEYRLILPDLRGHGQSEAPPGPYRMDQMADDLRALLKALKVEQVVLAGLSMGGYVAFSFWRIYPDMVRALVLSDTRAVDDTPEGRLNRQAMVEQVKEQGSEPIIEGMLPQLLSSETIQEKAAVISYTRQMMENASPQGIIGALQGMAERIDSTPTLSTITVPTLIVVGEEDAITPPAEAKAMREEILSGRRTGAAKHNIPPVTIARISHAGHLAPLENPDAFNLALREFLTGLD